jgi:hypothetical protein
MAQPVKLMDGIRYDRSERAWFLRRNKSHMGRDNMILSISGSCFLTWVSSVCLKNLKIVRVGEKWKGPAEMLVLNQAQNKAFVDQLLLGCRCFVSSPKRSLKSTPEIF